MLGGAVNAATTGSNAVYIEHDDFTPRIGLLQHCFGGCIRFCVTKFLRNHCAVAHIKTDITGGKLIV